ncbi:MAG: lactate utilization protein B/C [Gammaproteobacteria bacterium]|nr:lactate utilization protein B/C [Gammaproteobacteria bacterium]
MSSRDSILSALRELNLPRQEMPRIQIEADHEDLVGKLENNLGNQAGEMQRISDISEIQPRLDGMIADNKQVLSLIEGLTGNRELDGQTRNLKDVDLTVLAGDLACAENGAVYVRDTLTGHRVVPFITENLALVVKKENIVANMHEAMSQVTLEPGRFATFIAGPSKTADIEQALVVGAHGPFSLTLYVVG